MSKVLGPTLRRNCRTEPAHLPERWKCLSWAPTANSCSFPTREGLTRKEILIPKNPGVLALPSPQNAGSSPHYFIITLKTHQHSSAASPSGQSPASLSCLSFPPSSLQEPRLFCLLCALQPGPLGAVVAAASGPWDGGCDSHPRSMQQLPRQRARGPSATQAAITPTDPP